MYQIAVNKINHNLEIKNKTPIFTLAGNQIASSGGNSTAGNVTNTMGPNSGGIVSGNQTASNTGMP